MKTLVLFVSLVSSALLDAQAPAALSVIDQTLSVTMSGPGVGALVPFHADDIHLAGPPLARTFLVLSDSWPYSGPTSFNGIPVGVDINNLVTLWDGFTNPSAPAIGANGVLDVPFVVPDTSLIGTVIHVQALMQAAGGPLLITNHLDLRFSGEPLTHVASGSQSSHPLTLAGGATVVVTTATDWATLWSLHAPGTTAPTVNFATDFVIVRFMGSFAYPNETTSIDDAIRDGAGVLHIYLTQSFGGALPPPQPSQPFDMVSVTRSILSTTVHEHVHNNYYP